MHHGIKAYFDGKFLLAPLDNPQTILDVGYAFYIAYTWVYAKSHR
jgi:hypothetical protein